MLTSTKTLLWLVGASLLYATGLQARDIAVSSPAALQARLDTAEAGDHLILQSGTYTGNFTINQSIKLSGDGEVILDGGGEGRILTINAVGVEVRNLQIRHWGDDLTEIDAGIFIAKQARNAHIVNNVFYGDAFGIWVDAAEDVQLLNNKIEGNLKLRSPDRGNGIHLYGVKGALVADNEVWHSRDGIYIESSNGNELRGNYLHDVRYGVHYMYSYHNKLLGNRTRNTRTGYALMQSKFLTVLGNSSENDLNYGILMNFITNSTLSNNRVEGAHSLEDGPAGSQGKAVFVYNSLFNTISDNLFARSDLGIHLTAGSENNKLFGNAFVGNREQVKYVANRKQDWSFEGRGNYWSDYLGWDMDGDGVGDIAYEPNDGVDKLLWKYPEVRVLLNSPAIETLRWVQRQFPVLKSPGVRDSVPLMKPPAVVTAPVPDATVIASNQDHL